MSITTRLFTLFALSLSLVLTACDNGTPEQTSEAPATEQTKPLRKVGVILAVHGGGGDKRGMTQATLWESAIQIFSYDPNNSIYKHVIWNPQAWPTVAQMGDGQRYSNIMSQIEKYKFQNSVVGIDPSRNITVAQWEDMTKALEARGKEIGVEFITDWMGWIANVSDIGHLPWPRYMYNPKIPGGSPVTYCCSEGDGGVGPDKTWAGCNPERYNVDGPAERLIKQGAEEIIVIDMTTSGVRFVKTFEEVGRTREAIHEYNEANGTDIKVSWVNDPNDLMTRSFPSAPEGWTRALEDPEIDVDIPLEGNPNPVTNDPYLASMMVDGIESEFNPDVSMEDTAVFIINHSISRHNETFDPKVNDTLILNDNIKAELMRRQPNIKPENIIGGWMGVKQVNENISNPMNETAKLERTRDMRAENLGHAYLYQSDKVLPGGDWQYRYWDGFKILKDRGVKHIVVIFSQIVMDSVLNMVEVHNQIGKEIGYKTWMHWATGHKNYPERGHPFADYWGIWSKTQCMPIGSSSEDAELVDCCLTMGGCEGTDQPYPPLRQTPITKSMPDTDPSVTYDVPAYGHLGYDAAKGAPNDDAPVQDQYTGTWAMWNPLNDDPRMGEFLADHVVRFMEKRGASDSAH